MECVNCAMSSMPTAPLPRLEKASTGSIACLSAVDRLSGSGITSSCHMTAGILTGGHVSTCHRLQPRPIRKSVLDHSLRKINYSFFRVHGKPDRSQNNWRLKAIRSEQQNEGAASKPPVNGGGQNNGASSPSAGVSKVPVYGLPVAPAQSPPGISSQLSADQEATSGTLPIVDDCIAEEAPLAEKKREGSDLGTLWRRFIQVAAPYWSSEDKVQARLRLGAVFALTLATTGISVAFNFLGRDFYNALASKDEEAFTRQLLYYLGAFVGGIPVFVLRDYNRNLLALRWRAWMTSYYMDRYFKYRTFYNIQSQSLIDNPDQRIVDDVMHFTSTALGFSLALFNATIDLVSFSGILYGIYPPLFAVLIVYSLGGTVISVALGKNLVGLNFQQEKREADFRYGLVRVRENAEAIAFYGGEAAEGQLLLRRFKEAFQNYTQLLLSTRNLEFFTSGYRYLIQLLPAAVVAPLYFAGKIEFGVINQSFSAFNHVLSDFSIIVYQFQALSSFSAIVDRLGEFNDVLDSLADSATKSASSSDGSKEATTLTTTPDASESPTPSPPTSDSPQTLKPTIALIDIPIGQSQPGILSNGSAQSEADHENGNAGLGLGLGSGLGPGEEGRQRLLEIEDLTVYTPQYTTALVEGLSMAVYEGDHMLIMGASGSGKTSLLRAIAGLWRSGSGTIRRYVDVPPPTSTPARQEASSEPSSSSSSSHASPLQETSSTSLSSPAPPQEASSPPSSQPTYASSEEASSQLPSSSGATSQEASTSSSPSSGPSPSGSLDEAGTVFFVPQRPYMVLGTLRQQLLYPTWSKEMETSGVGEIKGFPNVSTKPSPEPASTESASSPSVTHNRSGRPPPSDAELQEVLLRVRLGHLLQRCEGLEAKVEWASVLSLGEQQRLAFARLLLSRPGLALMDESTSALDEQNEAHLYREVAAAGVTFVSIGHRSSLRQFHTHLLTLRPPPPEGGPARTWALTRVPDQAPVLETASK